MLVGFAILGFVVSGLIGLLIMWASAGGNMKDLSNIMKDPQHAGTVRLIQGVSVIITMFLPALLVATILSRKPLRLLGFRKEADLSQIGLVLVIMFISLLVAGAFGSLNKDVADALNWRGWSEQLEKNYNEQVGMMLDMDGVGGYLISLFIMAFLPAVCEEVLFRGGLQNFLTKATKSPWLSIIVISILFSLVHFSVYGFLVRFFLGVVLGLIYQYTKNVWLCISGHFFNNALAVTSIYFFMQQGESMKGALDKNISLAYWGFLALPIIIGLFIVLKNISHRSQFNPAENTD